MAEIKNTLDMVMERAARMAAASEAEEVNEDVQKEGMRLAAGFLNQPDDDLATQLAAKPAEQQTALRQGMAQTLLRNIVLPRDPALKDRSLLAIKGVLGLLQKSGGAAVTGACSELQQLLDQYSQHKEQITKQLEDMLVGQLEQQYTARGIQPPARLNAAMHPKYKDELARMLQDLNGQYNQAMDQRKQAITRQAGL